MQRTGLQQLKSGIVHGPFDFHRHAHHVFNAPQQARRVRQPAIRVRHGSETISTGTALRVDAAHLMILAAGRDADQSAVARQLITIRRHLALRDRRAEPPGRTQDHGAVRPDSLSPPPDARADNQRLYQNPHGGIGGIDIVRRHVAQRARGPQSAPAGANRGDEIRLALDAQESFRTGPRSWIRNRSSTSADDRTTVNAPVRAFSSRHAASSGSSTAGVIG